MQKTELKHKAEHWQKRLLTFLKWVLLSIGIGVLIGGGVGTLFYYLLQWTTQTRTNSPWLLFLLPAGGLFIVWLYRACGVKQSRGTDLVLLAVRSPQPLPARMAPLIFIATAVTHLFGGSAGREGAALQIGGSLGYSAGRLFKLDEKALHVVTMCGMGAVFSALFGTPVAAAVFAMEVVSVGQMYYSALVPVTISSLLASPAALARCQLTTYSLKSAAACIYCQHCRLPCWPRFALQSPFCFAKPCTWPVGCTSTFFQTLIYGY